MVISASLCSAQGLAPSRSFLPAEQRKEERKEQVRTWRREGPSAFGYNGTVSRVADVV